MNRLTAAIAAATLTLGLLIGAAGATLVANATPDSNDRPWQMSRMHDSMSDVMYPRMMGGQAGPGMMGGQRGPQGAQP